MGWYAVYTRPRHEKKVYGLLLEKEVEAFLPLRTEIRQWQDRRKKVETPLFGSYVFVQMKLQHRLTVLETHGVVRLVSFGGEPASIPAWQIEQLQRLQANGQPLEPETWLRSGTPVEITSGPLQGIRGLLLERRGDLRVAVQLEGIYQAASFVIGRDQIARVVE